MRADKSMRVDDLVTPMTADQQARLDMIKSLAREPEPFPIPGSELVLQLEPMDMEQFITFANLARPLFRAALAQGPDASPEARIGAVLIAASEDPEAFVQALAVATGEHRDLVAKLSPPVAFTLVERLLAINADVIVQGFDGFARLRTSMLPGAEASQSPQEASTQ